MLTLYIKRGCPWCDMAEEWLSARGIPYNPVGLRFPQLEESWYLYRS